LTSIKIPNTVISIGSSSFFNCSKLESITLPDSVRSIGRFAFSSCSSLKKVNIGDGVLCIFPSAFQDCNNLTQLTTKSKKIDIPDGFVIDNDNNVTFIYVKQDILEVTGNIEIPEGVTEISYNAFEECSSLKNITIPDSLITIGNCAFEGCRSLESVTFGENSSLTTIGNSVFVNCFSLESITIPDSVISIGTCAFEGCTFEGCSSLKSVTFGENSNLTIIGSCAFYNYNPSLLTLDIPNSVTSIGEDAFKNVNNVNISESQKELKGYSSKWGALHVNGE
jgi:hypothetical protein